MIPAIRVERLSKRYHIGTGSGRYRTLRESLSSALTSPLRLIRGQRNSQAASKSFWALKDVSFEVQQGEVIGIIGRNGAGKSTLLKVLSQIVEPTHGRAEFRGRIGSLLEVGTGFHPELSGRENIYLNGSILGMSRREISRKFDEIVAFSEIEEFLETPVKRYSSGMYVRLAFAVASHLDPEILIIDEVLAVGDQEFQRKCMGKMAEISQSARTILFVSHNMAAIQKLCSSVVVLDRGEVSFTGPCAQGVVHYMQRSESHNEGVIDLKNHVRRCSGSVPVLQTMRIRNGDGIATNQFGCGESLSIEIETDWRQPPAMVHFWVSVTDTSGCRLFTTGTFLADSGPLSLPDAKTVTCNLAGLQLAPGRYAFDVYAKPLYAHSPLDQIDAAAWIDVVPTDYYSNGRLPDANLGAFLTRSSWSGSDV